MFDGDLLVYKASSSVQKDIDWGDGLWTCHAFLEDAIVQAEVLLKDILDELTSDFGINAHSEYKKVFAFSDPNNNFRKKLCKTYKANRANNRKPTCYMALRKYFETTYDCRYEYNLEGDDILGILATDPLCKDSIIISGDKDFKTVPGMFYDFMRKELNTISNEKAYYWLMYQALVGDTADGYKGCPKMGAVTAKRLLDSLEPKDYWSKVVESFEKQGLTEDDAILQVRLAHLLWNKDYNRDTHEIHLWTPEDVCD